MEIDALQLAISVLREVRSGTSSSRLLHELQLLRHQFSIPHSETCEVTINRLKMELQCRVERARRMEKNRKRLRRMVCFNGMLGGFTGNWVSGLSRSLHHHPNMRLSSIGVISWKLKCVIMSLPSG